jgi:hypothetical protein
LYFPVFEAEAAAREPEATPIPRGRGKHIETSEKGCLSCLFDVADIFQCETGLPN